MKSLIGIAAIALIVVLFLPSHSPLVIAQISIQPTPTPTHTPTPIPPTPPTPIPPTPTFTPTPIPPTPTPIPPTQTFTPTPTPVPPEGQIDILVEDVEALGLPNNSEKVLLKKLNDALDKLDDGKTDGAIDKLNGFIDKVNRSPIKEEIDQATADALITAAQAIIDAINAP